MMTENFKRIARHDQSDETAMVLRRQKSKNKGASVWYQGEKRALTPRFSVTSIGAMSRLPRPCQRTNRQRMEGVNLQNRLDMNHRRVGTHLCPR